MKEELISLIEKDGEIPDEVFTQIFEIPDAVERMKYINRLKAKAREVKRLREVSEFIKVWNTKFAQERKQQGSNKTEFTEAPLILNCGSYIARDTGVEFIDSSTGYPVTKKVCPHPILPTERFINIDSGLEKIKLEYFKDNMWKSLVAECAVLFNKNYICSLADKGIMVTSENSRELVKYISEIISLNVRELPLYRSISRLGWVSEDEFAPYVNDLKYDGEDCFVNIYKHIAEKGDFNIWKNHISKLRENINIRLMMAVNIRLMMAASFASPLIEVVGALPFVLHLWGTTGFGKTVSLMTAMSIWGNPEMGCLTRTMNMTQNSMARTASFLYSIPFAADELQQIKSKWDNYDNLVMYLTEGIDRGRAKARGGIEEIKIWKNCFIFTGEEPITKSESGGGVKNRVIEIEVGDRIVPDGNFTANTVKANYGHAGKLFIETIINSDNLMEQYKDIFKEILNKTDTTEKQAMSMALILLADKLACNCIFDSEEPLSVYDVKEYLTSIKAVDAALRAYEWCLSWIAENEIRFKAAGEDNKGAVWGKIEENFAMISKNILSQELGKVGFDYTAITKAWANKGLIERNSQGKLVHQTKVFNVKASYIKLLFDIQPMQLGVDYDVEKISGDDKLPF